MDDPVVQVRDSAVWTLGRVCEQVPSAVLSEQNDPSEIREQKDQYLLKLLDGLCRGLQGEPRVATNSCWVRGFGPGGGSGRSAICPRRRLGRVPPVPGGAWEECHLSHVGIGRSVTCPGVPPVPGGNWEGCHLSQVRIES